MNILMRDYMTVQQKLIDKVISGRSDHDIKFNDLCSLLKQLGFEERIRGSHHIFRKEGARENLNLQSEGSQAKGHQVRKVRDIILKYQLN